MSVESMHLLKGWIEIPSLKHLQNVSKVVVSVLESPARAFRGRCAVRRGSRSDVISGQIVGSGVCRRGVWTLLWRPICCDAADQNHASLCGAMETDGQRSMKTAEPSPFKANASVSVWREMAQYG